MTREKPPVVKPMEHAAEAFVNGIRRSAHSGRRCHRMRLPALPTSSLHFSKAGQPMECGKNSGSSHKPQNLAEQPDEEFVPIRVTLSGPPFVY